MSKRGRSKGRTTAADQQAMGARQAARQVLHEIDNQLELLERQGRELSSLIGQLRSRCKAQLTGREQISPVLVQAYLPTVGRMIIQMTEASTRLLVENPPDAPQPGQPAGAGHLQGRLVILGGGDPAELPLELIQLIDLSHANGWGPTTLHQTWGKA